MLGVVVAVGRDRDMSTLSWLGQATSNAKAGGRHSRMGQRKNDSKLVEAAIFVKQRPNEAKRTFANWKHDGLKPVRVSRRRCYNKRGSKASYALFPKYHW